MNKTLGAFTPPGADYPPYVNLSEKDGAVVVTVREARRYNGDCGQTVSMALPRDEAITLLREALSNLEGETR